MGQLVEKFKQFVEELKLHDDRSRHGVAGALSSNGSNEDVALLSEYEDKATITDDLYKQDRELLQKVLGKLELIETVVESQRQTIDEHGTKIEALRDAIRSEKKPDNEKDNENAQEVAESDVEKESAIGRIFDSIFQDKPKSETCTETNQLLVQHSEVLKTVEEKLQTAMKKIEAINEIVEDEKGFYKKTTELEETIKGLRKAMEKIKADHESFKVENSRQMEMHQKLLDNLFSGFIVAFLIVIIACMFGR